MSQGCLMWAGDCFLFPELQKPRLQRKGSALRDSSNPETTTNRLSVNNFFKKRGKNKSTKACLVVDAVSNVYILYILKHIEYIKQQLLKGKKIPLLLLHKHNPKIL